MKNFLTTPLLAIIWSWIFSLSSAKYFKLLDWGIATSPTNIVGTSALWWLIWFHAFSLNLARGHCQNRQKIFVSPRLITPHCQCQDLIYSRTVSSATLMIVYIMIINRLHITEACWCIHPLNFYTDHMPSFVSKHHQLVTSIEINCQWGTFCAAKLLVFC